MPPGERPLEGEARAGAVHTRAQLRVQIIVSSHELAVKVSLHESATCGARACSAAGSNRGFQVLALPESGGLWYTLSS